MAMVASHKITAIACMAGYTVEPKSDDYSPIPVMEFHGFLDPGVLYGHSSTASYQVAGTLEGEEGAIQNLYMWADANGCSASCPTLTRSNRTTRSRNSPIAKTVQKPRCTP